MKKVRTINELQQLLGRREKPVGFVPTMGSLHQGHVSLIERAVRECHTVVLSVFVNPLQFGPGEDWESYPRDILNDATIAQNAGAHILFHPLGEELLPAPQYTSVSVSHLTKGLCGRYRPGHFDGVATILTKFFHIIQPDKAYFGWKDAQQVAVILQMVRDLHFPIEIIPCATVREPDGLAYSSRNVYLSSEERLKAPILYRSLQRALEVLVHSPKISSGALELLVRQELSREPMIQVEYIEVRTFPTLDLLEYITNEKVMIAVAIKLGQTRLIDNVVWCREDRLCTEQ